MKKKKGKPIIIIFLALSLINIYFSSSEINATQNKIILLYELSERRIKI